MTHPQQNRHPGAQRVKAWSVSKSLLDAVKEDCLIAASGDRGGSFVPVTSHCAFHAGPCPPGHCFSCESGQDVKEPLDVFRLGHQVLEPLEVVRLLRCVRIGQSMGARTCPQRVSKRAPVLRDDLPGAVDGWVLARTAAGGTFVVSCCLFEQYGSFTWAGTGYRYQYLRLTRLRSTVSFEHVAHDCCVPVVVGQWGEAPRVFYGVQQGVVVERSVGFVRFFGCGSGEDC
jgi:hypothetical protein